MTQLRPCKARVRRPQSGHWSSAQGRTVTNWSCLGQWPGRRTQRDSRWSTLPDFLFISSFSNSRMSSPSNLGQLASGRSGHHITVFSCTFILIHYGSSRSLLWSQASNTPGPRRASGSCPVKTQRATRRKLAGGWYQVLCVTRPGRCVCSRMTALWLRIRQLLPMNHNNTVCYQCHYMDQLKYIEESKIEETLNKSTHDRYKQMEG